MFKNYFKAMLRNLWKNKTYSFLNIFGLAIGIVCAGVIFLWVEDEVNYDNVNLKKPQLYQVMQNWNYDGYIPTFRSTPGLLAASIKADIPGIKEVCRVTDFSPSLLFSIGDKSMYASGLYADASLFNMFTIPFVQGDAKTAFAQLYSVVITERTAKKFFGEEENVVGKTLKVDNKQVYTVSGVVKDFPENSTVRFEWAAPFGVYALENGSLTDWGSNAPYTYVELDPSANPDAINKQLYDYVKSKQPTTITHAFLLAMKDWHLRSNFDNGVQSGGRIQYVHMFSIIAWIILFIACINFMNLSTARSEKRAREVGVRKVMGAGKSGLIAQFIGEAIFMAALATLIAVLIMIVVLPYCNTLMDKNLHIGLGNPVHLSALLLIAIVCGLVAGSYPSLYLSSFNPVFVLKGLNIKTGGAAFIRKGLVVLQFTVSIVLIISTIIIYQQIRHVKSRNLGYDKDNLIVMNMQGDMLKNFTAIKEDMLNTGAIENMALANVITMYGGNNTGNVGWEGKDPNKKILFSIRVVDPAFMATLGMRIIDGRDFQTNAVADSFNVIITESMAKLMGTGSAVGKAISYTGFPGSANGNLRVVGVVNDYVYGNMYGQSDPVIFGCFPSRATVTYIRTKAGRDMEQTLAKMEAVMHKYNPGYPFEYRFVDDMFNWQFTNEMLISKLTRIFASLAIIISCLGLFGLAAYTAERRTKEIGIRKVLGASVAGIAGLLSKDFLQLVCLSTLIAFPLAWWAMSVWLQGYAYRVSIHWWVFLVAGVCAVFISLLTVSYQSVRAALMDPVKSLKTD
ncbi:duplicated orphan permease [Chitinophaga sp. YR573]|uniref:ABC transporter permease n=1 Tax=Chitinophaga sp. YR573 TaxID=1881040 RepID=UPI0008C084C2|nr:ABC transporter permease [Chitinophaga sp. YR573]SEW15942.1 duplicated orphan permease [Chitinophaga sp. YR573]